MALALAALAALSVLGGVAEGGMEQRINVVLLGATGNLAEKYLWQGLYNIHADGLPGGVKVSPWPAATKDAATSQPILDRILLNNVTGRSEESKAEFLARVPAYSQLRNPEHYAELDAKIRGDTAASGETEVGRLFYLSVPPKFFGGIAANIHKYLGPQESEGWLRVVVEKPFGVDLASAEQLAQDLFKSLRADEVLLVDHYMGKETMHGLRHFVGQHRMRRIAGAESTGGVRKIEVGMLETDDCKGRTGFYDEVGVLRDTVQNHLMMMFALLGMETEGVADGQEPAMRKRLFEKVPAVGVQDVVKLGQYRSYNDHVNEDRAKWGEAPLDAASSTPSYVHAVVTLALGDKDPAKDAGALEWLRDVPIHFKSGKALSERRSFVEVTFNSGLVLVFNLQGPSSVEGLSGAFVFASEALGRFKEPPGWTMEAAAGGFVARPPPSPFAYEFLLRAGLEGRRENFVMLDEVLEAWRVWTPLLSALEDGKGQEAEMSLYDHGASLHADADANPAHDEL